MSVRAYSYLFKTTVTLLNEDEYAPIGQALSDLHNEAKALRKERGIFLKSFYRECDATKIVLGLCRELSDAPINHPLQAPELRLSRYGSLCKECEKPFRTPRAKVCVECGYQLPEGELAGPLTDG